MRCKCKNNIDGISSTWVSTYLISDDKIHVPLELTVRYPEGGRGAKPSSRARTSTRHVELTIVRQSTAATRHLPVVTIILYWYVVVVLPLVPGGWWMIRHEYLSLENMEQKAAADPIVTHSNGWVLRLKGWPAIGQPLEICGCVYSS